MTDDHPTDSADAPDPSNSLAFSKSVVDFSRPRGVELLGRTEELFEWFEARRHARALPYFRSLDGAPLPLTPVRDVDGRPQKGLNFASQDYLSLASHPAVQEAAIRAIHEFGVHSAGSGALLGNTRYSLELERGLAEHLEAEHVVLYPTGWAAGFGVILGLVRSYDYVVMDSLAHACLKQGAAAATQKVVQHVHLNEEAVVSELRAIRAKEAGAAILVVTEGLFSMDADMPKIAVLQDACREYEATLLVDVAHDLGALGPRGTGSIGSQGLLGKVDLVMGSFSKTFASNGGFVATHSPAVKEYVKLYGTSWMFSNALSPVQAAIVGETLRIVRSEEGDQRRADLMRGITALRDGFAGHGITCMGEPSPIVPVPVGSDAVGRLASALLFDRGVLANLAEYPAVPARSARFRMQVMAAHTEEQATEASGIVARTIVEARELLERTATVAR